MNAKEKRITLKEAAEMSGYTPDYLGQLIRKGKLPGEQVYANVAWVTTETAVQEYIENAKKGVQQKKSKPSRRFNEKRITALYCGFMYSALVLVASFLIFLFFLFSVQIDKKMNTAPVGGATSATNIAN